LVLRIDGLQLERDLQLLELATYDEPPPPLEADLLAEHVPRELLGDRTAAAGLAPDVVQRAAGDPEQVEAVVLVETAVLDRDERLAHVWRERRERDGCTALEEQLGDELPVVAQDLGGLVRLPHEDLGDGGAVVADVAPCAQGEAGAQGEERAEGEQHAGDEPRPGAEPASRPANGPTDPADPGKESRHWR